MARVRAAVRERWRADHARRTAVRRLAIGTALLAAAAALVVGVSLGRPRPSATPTAETVAATCERIEGAPVIERVVAGRAVVSPLVPNASLRVNDVVATDGSSRVGLRTPSGSSVRLDRQGRLRLHSPMAIELIGGAVYVMTAEGSPGFEVRTPVGALRDIGTQFEVRLDGAAVRVRVRTGHVEIHRGGDVIPARGGSEVRIAEAGVETSPMQSYGPAWAWTTTIAPVFQTEGRPLSAFLDHLAREEAWVVRFESPDLARAASSIVLHGSIERLTAEDALKVALATSGLDYRLTGGELVIFRPRNAR